MPLSDVADIIVDERPAAIKSENGRLNGWLLIDIEGRGLGSYVKDAKQFVASSHLAGGLFNQLAGAVWIYGTC